MFELVLRSSAILVVAWVVTRALPRATAATRHLVWHGALVASLLLPLTSLAQVPLWRLLPSLPDVHATETLQPIAPAIYLVPQALAVLDSISPATSSPVSSSPSATLQGTLSTLRILGTLGTLIWFGAGWLAASRLSRQARPAPLAWQLELNALCERLRIDRSIRLGIIETHSSPLATGLFRASILLPQAAAAWSPDRRRAVLLHELAHIKRRDCRVQLVAQAACALYWFNPLVWKAASALRTERERACDDEVLRCGAAASSYATHLLDIARELRPLARPTAALAMARPSELEGRLLSVLAAGRARVPARGARWVVVTFLSVTTVIASSAMSPADTRTATPPLASSNGAPYVVANDIVMSSAAAPQARNEAEATLQASNDPEDREHATLALAFTSGRDVIPALLKALADRDPQVREKAAIGLALRRDARVVEPLIAAMQDADAQVREKVAIALGTSGDARARDVLIRALDDPDSQVREKATAALVLFGLTDVR